MHSTNEIVLARKIFGFIMAAIVAAFSFCKDVHIALQSVALWEVILSSVAFRECCQGIVRPELLTLITSSCWLCMRPLHLSGRSVGGGRSTE